MSAGFELRRGETLGFAGLMGAGRTEVARVIFGATTREAGEIASMASPAPSAAHVRRGRRRDQLSVRGTASTWLALGLDVRGQYRARLACRICRPDRPGRRRRAGPGSPGTISPQLAIRTPGPAEVRLLSGATSKGGHRQMALRDCDIPDL